MVLISGSGSNLQAIIEAIKNQQLHAKISAVISNKATAEGLERARKEKIATHIVDHKQFSSRQLFDQAMIKIIDPLKPTLVVLAGFMRILSDEFIKRYHHRLMNIHPSLLPKYKGLHTHQKAIDNNDKYHGASVHYVDIELDSGPVIIQSQVPILSTDTAETLAKRVLIEEHKVYPMAIKMHIDRRLKFQNNHLFLDDQPLRSTIRIRR